MNVTALDPNAIGPTIAATKHQLRAQLPDLDQRFAAVEDYIRQEVAAIQAGRQRGEPVIPELAYAEIAAGTVSQSALDHIRRRGAVVVRGVFARAQAEAWNEELGAYITDNGYYETPVDPNLDRYFSQLKSGRPQIFGIYWSKPQIQARQAASMAKTKAFLNNLWRSRRDGEVYFDPDRECTYADRIRRREPGDVSLGLSPHTDAGSVERWLDPHYRGVYRHVFQGDWRDYDPFDGAHRVEVKEIPSPAVCSVFRTYQGWTALTTQGPHDGTLQLIPIAKGMAYVLLRALRADVPEDQLCGAEPARALSVSEQWHAPLLAGLVPIPQVEPGDTVWWHADVVHAVENQHRGSGYSNVMYIGAAPYCAKNATFLEKQKTAFLHGASCPDFAPEDFEVDYRGRATVADLTELGQRQMGLLAW